MGSTKGKSRPHHLVCKPAIAVFFSREKARFDKSNPIGIQERLNAERTVLDIQKYSSLEPG